MSTAFSENTTSHYNPDEPRDGRGRWTTGGSSWRDNPLRNPGAVGRAHTLLGHALASARHQGIIRQFSLPTQAEAEGFARTLGAWNAAANLDHDSFHDLFTRGLVDKPATVSRLRRAAAGSVQAETIGQMVDASRPLTAAIKDIGGERWPWMRQELGERAKSVMPSVQLVARTHTTSQQKKQPPVSKGCEVGDGKIHLSITNKDLDGPEPEDGWKPFDTPIDNSSTPEQRKRFYDCLYDKLEAMAKRLGIKVEWLLGLAAHESGWLNEHNWHLRNPFGLTKSGGPNLCYNTFLSVVDYWEKLFGPRVKGAQSLDAFLDALGKGENKYNSADPGWRNAVKEVIKSQAHFIASWNPEKKK